MTARYLLDTNVCIHIRRRRPLVVARRFESLDRGSVVMSAITFGELTYGVAKSVGRDEASMELDRLAALIPVIPITEDASRCYGTIRADLTVRGMLIGGNDLWIAAHAKSAGLILVTNNIREFSRVDGLTIEDWTVSL